MSGEELLVDAVAAADEDQDSVEPEEAGDSKVSGNPAAVACFGIWSVRCDQRDPRALRYPHEAHGMARSVLGICTRRCQSVNRRGGCDGLPK